MLVDGRRQVAVGLVTAVGREVLPEDRVEDVAGDVEGERLLEADDGAEVVLVAGRAASFSSVVFAPAT